MKKVLITGGSRGIGRACVEAFTAAGYSVAFIYGKSDEKANALALQTGAYAIKADVSDPEAVKEAVGRALERLGGIDVLVNNAGVSYVGLIQDMTDAEWRRVIDTNLSGAFYLTRAVIPTMLRAQGGRIINVGSVWGRCGASCEAAYSASKAALRGLTTSLAKELGPSGITVNCVEPGVIDTDMNACFDSETMDELCSETPLGRIGKPSEVASLIRFLASDDASFITGQCIGIDGGFAL